MKYGSAKFSRCGQYRYLLERSENADFRGPSVTFVMLNPAKADALKNDQTIAKCVGFAKRWNMQSLRVINLYGYCTSYQTELYAAGEPEGPMNKYWQRRVLSNSDKVVCAWGKGVDSKRVKSIARLAAKHGVKLFCLGLNLDGSPKHPARISYHQKLEPFNV